MLENQPTGTFVLQVNAVDADEGANGKVKYGLMHRDSAMPAFRIHPDTGGVVTDCRGRSGTRSDSAAQGLRQAVLGFRRQIDVSKFVGRGTESLPRPKISSAPDIFINILNFFTLTKWRTNTGAALKASPGGLYILFSLIAPKRPP